jgi:cold shock protein
LESTVTGTIRTIRADKGFGFIKDPSGKEYFFHRSAVYGEGLEDLREGDSVEFEVGEGPKGPRAENVRRTST